MFNSKRLLCYVIVLMLLLLSVFEPVTSQTCQNNFVSSLYQCLGNRSLDRENFLWVARNGSLGSKPDDLQSFVSRVCIEKPGLFQCTKTALDNARAQSELTCPQLQKDSLTKLFKGIFKTLNQKCEHPCRKTFVQTLTKCYSDFNFGSSFLLFNVTSRRDAILGLNTTESERFCQHSSNIVQCMKSAAVNCNDSPALLRSYSLDLNALNDTYTILCNHTKVYKDVAHCFREPTVNVMKCRNTIASEVGILEAQLADINITDSIFKQDICNLRIDQIQCEMNAIRQENDTSTCHNVIIGMRRQQECTLMPRECIIGNQDRLSILCRSADYLIPERAAYSKGGSGNVIMVTPCLLILSVVILLLSSLTLF